MFISNNPWSAVDSSELMRFLASDTGVKYLELIAMMAPRPKTAEGFEKSALQAERYFGWLDVRDWTLAMTEPPRELMKAPEWHVETPAAQDSPNPL